MFKFVVLVALFAVAFAAEQPLRVVRQVVNPVTPVPQIVNPYNRPNYQGRYQGNYQGNYQGAYQGNYQPYAKGAEAAARIVSQQQDVDPSGTSYAYAYETENGISAQQQGQWRAISQEDGIQSVVGNYRYPLPDGRFVIVEYQADENGYRPVVKYQ